jgi:hypothetical protein
VGEPIVITVSLRKLDFILRISKESSWEGVQFFDVKPKPLSPELVNVYDLTSTFQADQLLQNFIAGGDNPGICLECPLGGYHFNKFLSQIDIRHFYGTRTDAT